MTDMKQPEALRLAKTLEALGDYNFNTEAAAELRRQHAEIEALRAKLDELENQGPMSITGAQALDALDELDASARGDEPYNHFAAPLIRGYVESTIAADKKEPS